MQKAAQILLYGYCVATSIGYFSEMAQVITSQPMFRLSLQLVRVLSLQLVRLLSLQLVRVLSLQLVRLLSLQLVRVPYLLDQTPLSISRRS